MSGNSPPSPKPCPATSNNTPDLHRIWKHDIDHALTSLNNSHIIEKKKFLKNTYWDFYRRFLDAAGESAPEGPWIEIGSGGGFIKEVIPRVKTSDVVEIRSLTDLTFSALKMPFESGSVGIFFLLNTFHHLHDVSLFLNECQRCLKSGGKIVMIEPANTPWSRWIYKKFHHEPFDEKMSEWMTEGGRLSGGNQALPWIVFVRDRKRFDAAFPLLKIISIEAHTPFRYLISGGLNYPHSFPSILYPVVRLFENLMKPVHRFCGMFMTVVIQKQ
jgi:SAM-dependent methyltransferase